MLHKINLEHILFLDIETVPQQSAFNEMDEEYQKLYADKTKYQRRDDSTAEEFYDRAGIWAEFGKICCISVGFFKLVGENRSFRTTTYSGTEETILIAFKELLEKHFNKNHHVLCAHNGKEFDFPYIARRMVIHGIKIPAKLNLFGKKPWEVKHLDTLELWKFGDHKHYTSLKLLTKILNIPSPKTDIDGSQVRDVYYDENDVERIILYCERDVVAIAQVILRFRNEPLLRDDEVVSV